MADTLLIGPGWLGAPAAEALAHRAHRVWTLSRSGHVAPRGCTSVAGDITSADTPDGLAALRRRLPPSIRQLVVCVAPSSERGDSYAIYPAAARGAAALVQALGISAVVYLSSTGIYDRQDGSFVTEHSLIAPANDRVRALFEAELALLATASPTRAVHVLRAAGLYGPGRDPATRFRTGATAPDTWCNFSWRDDVVAAIAHCLALPPSGKGEIFNCTDDTPVQAGAITQALTGMRPEHGGAPDASGRIRAGRSNQRISSAALMRTGWRPQVPDVFEGLRLLGHAVPRRGDTA